MNKDSGRPAKFIKVETYSMYLDCLLFCVLNRDIIKQGELGDEIHTLIQMTNELSTLDIHAASIN